MSTQGPKALRQGHVQPLLSHLWSQEDGNRVRAYPQTGVCQGNVPELLLLSIQ